MEDKKLKILIADDEEGLRLSMAGIIEMEGHEVMTAVDGYEAIELAKHNSFDIAFLDIKMPGINGVETFKEIKKVSPETVVVMMTAYAVAHLIKEAINEGAYACMNKPFDMDKIMETIKDVSKKPFVVVVEDDPKLCETFNTKFKEQGYNVVIRPSSSESVGIVSRRTPDIIFFDVASDGRNVLDAFRKMKETIGDKFPRTILLGNNPSDPVVEEMRKMGVVEFMQKSRDPEELKAAVGKMLDKDKKLKIFIVDDDKMLCDSLQNCLAGGGYDVEIANNGEEALRKMNGGVKNDDFRIVILDVRLPGVNGLEIYDKIKKTSPGTGVIFISGLDQNDGLNTSISKHNYSYLHKPFDPENLIRLIEHIKETKLQNNPDSGAT